METEVNINLDKAVELGDNETNNKMKIIEKELDRIRYKVFGKISVGKEKIKNREESLKKLQIQRENLYSKYQGKELEEEVTNVNEKMKKVIMDSEKDKLEEDVKVLNKLKHTKGYSAAVFKLKRHAGSKKIKAGTYCSQRP